MELIGIDVQLEKIKDWLKNWDVQSKKGILLHGPPGVGKTESVYALAGKQGYDVVEFNASDKRRKEFMKELLTAVRSKGVRKRLFLLDESDHISDRRGLEKVLKETKNPVFLTVNYTKSLGNIRKYCTEVRFYRPRLGDVVKSGEREGAKEFEDVARDHRQGKLKKYGTEGYNDETMKERINRMVTEGDYSDIERRDYMALIKRTKDLYGIDVWKFMQSLRISDYCDSPKPLEGTKIRR